MTHTATAFALRVVFESGRARIVRVFDTQADADAALYDLDMCGIAKAHVITVAD